MTSFKANVRMGAVGPVVHGIRPNAIQTSWKSQIDDLISRDHDSG